jgi:hypothetical protein
MQTLVDAVKWKEEKREKLQSSPCYVNVQDKIIGPVGFFAVQPE